MKNNNTNIQHDWIKVNQTKFFFIGFIVSIIPYCILMSSILQIERYQNLTTLHYILLFLGIITAIGNGFSLKKQFINKMTQLKKEGKIL